MVKPKKFTADRCKSLLKIRAKVFAEARTWLNNQGFTEVQGPILLPATGARANSFKVNYFGHDAFLAGGLNPYSDFFMNTLGKIFTIAPIRGEPEDDSRHLAEYWRIEANALSCQFEDILTLQEQMLKHILSKLLEDKAKELIHLTGSLAHIERVKLPLFRLTYDKAIEKLHEKGWDIFWGQPFDWETERELSLTFDQPFFITEFPVSGEWLNMSQLKKKYFNVIL
jgi:asparaginyl-tRNA synthetase